jgi:hypothetical protein
LGNIRRGVYGISRTIEPNKFILGCTFILGNPVPLLENAVTAGKNRVKNDNEKEWLQELPQNSWIITQLLPSSL